jgi:hypothetical protein
MMNSSAALAEMPAAPATEVLRKGRTREGKSSRRSSAKPKASSRERYFLGTGKPGDQVAVGRELKSEKEALVAAFQEKVTFFVVTEYRVDTQFKGASAILVKEGVSRADS